MARIRTPRSAKRVTLVARIQEYLRQGVRDFGFQLSVIREELGATPECRSMPELKLPNLKEAYAELAVLRARVQALEETLRQAGITP